MNQIALPFETKASNTASSYLVTECNRDQHDQLNDWHNWPNGVAILIGQTRSGKTAMVEQFVRQSGGLSIEDAEHVDDDTLFHLWNRAQMEKRPLLIASPLSVTDWDVELPDLKSRLASSLLIEIGLPDEHMIKGLFQKYISERGSTISEDATSYLVKRVGRNYAEVEKLAHMMDRLAIERKKPVTLAVAKDALALAQNPSASAPASGGK